MRAVSLELSRVRFRPNGDVDILTKGDNNQVSLSPQLASVPRAQWCSARYRRILADDVGDVPVSIQPGG